MLQDWHGWCPRARDHVETEIVDRNNRGHPWKTNSKYSTEKKKRSQTSLAKLCKVRKHRYYQSFAGKRLTWVRKKKETRERMDWGSWSIFRPAEGIEGSRLIRQRTGDTDSCLDALEDQSTPPIASEPRWGWEVDSLLEAPYRRLRWPGWKPSTWFVRKARGTKSSSPRIFLYFVWQLWMWIYPLKRGCLSLSLHVCLWSNKVGMRFKSQNKKGEKKQVAVQVGKEHGLRSPTWKFCIFLKLCFMMKRERDWEKYTPLGNEIRLF